VANITDDVLLGLDLMEQYNKFQLDLENRVIGQNKIVMTTPEQKSQIRKVTLQENMNLPARSESIVKIHVDEEIELQLVEPSYARRCEEGTACGSSLS